MPLKKGSSKKTISKNIETEMKKFKKTGKVGTSKPASKEKAVKQAAAIAYSKAGKKKNDENSECMKKRKDENSESKQKNNKNLADNYPPYNKVTRGDIIAGAKGEDQMGGKKKTKKKDESYEETLKESFESFVKNTLKKIFSLE